MIYIGADDGIYRWVPKSFWPVFHSLQGRKVVSLAAPGAGLLAAVDAEGRVWESTSNGLEWVEIPAPAGGCVPLGVSAGAPRASILLTTRPLGIYQRHVGAPAPEVPATGAPALWKGLLSAASGAVAVARKASKTKEHPAAGGDGWTKLAAPAASDKGSSAVIRTIAAGAVEPAALFAAVAGAGLWRSDDAGASWVHTEGLPAEVHAIRVVPQKEGPGTVFLGTSSGCWVSTDAGRTWESRSGGLEGANLVRAIEVHPEEPNSLFAGAAAAEGAPFALYESSDGGKSWARVRRGLPEAFERDTITDIRYDPDATENAIVALQSGELWRTRNGGDWWEPIARQIRSARALCATL